MECASTRGSRFLDVCPRAGGQRRTTTPGAHTQDVGGWVGLVGRPEEEETVERNRWRGSSASAMGFS